MWCHAQTQPSAWFYNTGLDTFPELSFLWIRAPASTKGCLKVLAELRAHYIQVHIDFEAAQKRLSLSKWDKGEKNTFPEH